MITAGGKKLDVFESDYNPTLDSSDRSILSINYSVSEGLYVIGKKEGKASIIVELEGVKKAVYEIKVTPVKATGITISNPPKTIPIGGREELRAKVIPDNTTDKTTTWTSSDPTIAEVKGSTIYAKKQGKVTVTAKTANGKTASCEISIVPVLATKLETTDKTVQTIKKGSKIKLNVTVKPDNTTNKGVTWSSSNTSIISVDSAGNIEANKEGRTSYNNSKI